MCNQIIGVPIFIGRAPGWNTIPVEKISKTSTRSLDILLLESGFESGFEPGLESGLEPGLESGLDQKNAKIRGIAITQWFCFIRHVTQAR